MISRQKVKFLEYETLHCWKSWDLEFHIFCLYLENVLINALKYSFIEEQTGVKYIELLK